MHTFQRKLDKNKQDRCRHLWENRRNSSSQRCNKGAGAMLGSVTHGWCGSDRQEIRTKNGSVPHGVGGRWVGLCQAGETVVPTHTTSAVSYHNDACRKQSLVAQEVSQFALLLLLLSLFIHQQGNYKARKSTRAWKQDINDTKQRLEILFDESLRDFLRSEKWSFNTGEADYSFVKKKLDFWRLVLGLWISTEKNRFLSPSSLFTIVPRLRQKKCNHLLQPPFFYKHYIT